MALLAFNLDPADFIVGGLDKSSRWDEITELQLVLPTDDPTETDPNITKGPATDYAFIGIDLGLVASSTSVVPEPSSSALLGVFGLSLLLRRSRK